MRPWDYEISVISLISQLSSTTWESESMQAQYGAL